MRPEKYYGSCFKPAEVTVRRQELERIELLKGRPDRQTVIGDDDILNLRITLGTSKDVLDVIEKV
jgi:hypothetical protein